MMTQVFVIWLVLQWIGGGHLARSEAHSGIFNDEDIQRHDSACTGLITLRGTSGFRVLTSNLTAAVRKISVVEAEVEGCWCWHLYSGRQGTGKRLELGRGVHSPNSLNVKSVYIVECTEARSFFKEAVLSDNEVGERRKTSPPTTTTVKVTTRTTSTTSTSTSPPTTTTTCTTSTSTTTTATTTTT